jgi:hypothetical protein
VKKGTKPRPATPMLEKLHGVSEDSQIIGGFLEWLYGQGVQLMRWDTQVTDSKPCMYQVRDRRSHEETQTTVEDLRHLNAELAGVDPATLPERPFPPPPPHPDTCACNGTGTLETTMEDWVVWGSGINPVLARYYDIDLDQCDRERKALLEWAREQNA